MLDTIGKRVTMTGAAGLAALGLAACGGGTTAATVSPSASASATAAAGTGGTRGAGGFGGGLSSAELTKATACLKAAGIAVPTLGARPSGAPNGGTPPSGAPNGACGFGGPGGGGLFSSAADQAALKACGITLPTRTGGQAAPAAPPSA